MTFEEYINNPMGSSILANSREMYRALYTKKFDTVMVRENGKMDYKLYKSKDKFYIYLKIPSEVVEKFYYDVVIEFSPSGKGFDTFKTLDKYKVRFFSNDPSFVFTFAHSFKQNDLFITELSSKMDKYALKHKAEIRNPKDEVSYVKSLYFAFLYTKNRGLLSKIQFATAPKIDFKELAKEIIDADIKIEQRQELGAKPKRERKPVEKKTDRSILGNIGNHINHIGFTKTTNKIGTSKTTKKTSTIGRKH